MLMNALEAIKQQLGKAYDDLEFLLSAFREVLIENGEETFARQIPWVNDVSFEDIDEFTVQHVQL